MSREGRAWSASVFFHQEHTTMITVKNATLRVKRINGRNGPFCIADLSTDFGEFKVKESLLDQFDEGT